MKSGKPPCPGCLLTSPAAAWLYAGPTKAWGRGHALGKLSTHWHFDLHTNDIGFGTPLQHTNGQYGTTLFNDYHYGRHDSLRVPNPPGNRWTPSCGWRPPSGRGQPPQLGATSCYGAYDGKDFLIDDRNGDFYDLDQIYVDAAGHPINFGRYRNGRGPCGAAPQPACGVRGIFAGNLATSAPNLGGSTAAGIVSGAGMVVAGELDCATCLNHAVQVAGAARLMNRATCNAFPTGKHGDGTATLPHAVLCEGGFLRWTGDWTRLDPATHAVAVIALARALQLYGGFITDQGGLDRDAISIYSGYDHAPALTGAAALLQPLTIYYGTTRLQ